MSRSHEGPGLSEVGSLTLFLMQNFISAVYSKVDGP